MRNLVKFACILSIILHVGDVRAETLRVMTYNVRWLVAEAGEKPQAGWRSDALLDAHYRSVAAVIAQHRPHVAALVEVTRPEAAQRLARMVNALAPLGYVAHHVDMHDSQTGQDVAVLARVPLESGPDGMLAHYYSRDASGPWRAAYAAPDGPADTSVSKNGVWKVTVGGRCLGFLGLHLVAHPNNPKRDAQRDAQAEVAGRILKAKVETGGCLPVVLGDFNDYDADVADAEDRFSATTNVLRRIKDYDPSRPGDELINTAARLPKDARYTALWQGAPRGPARTMIDHILVHRDLARFIARVDIPRAGADGVSDHWPVLVDFDFPTNTVRSTPGDFGAVDGYRLDQRMDRHPGAQAEASLRQGGDLRP